jgi:hypothetical protein
MPSFYLEGWKKDLYTKMYVALWLVNGGTESDLGVGKVAHGLFPDVIEQVLHSQALELIYPHAVVVRELCFRTHEAHLHACHMITEQPISQTVGHPKWVYQENLQGL